MARFSRPRLSCVRRSVPFSSCLPTDRWPVFLTRDLGFKVTFSALCRGNPSPASSSRRIVRRYLVAADGDARHRRRRKEQAAFGRAGDVAWLQGPAASTGGQARRASAERAGRAVMHMPWTLETAAVRRKPALHVQSEPLAPFHYQTRCRIALLNSVFAWSSLAPVDRDALSFK